MDRLASCYFCGVAVDAPLEEYPVVPRDLRPSVENQQTVVLCPECRRKLSTIVDSVAAAATDPDQTTLAGNSPDAVTSESTDAADDIEQPTEAIESTDDRPADSSLIEGFGHDDEPSLIEVEGTPEDDEPTAGDVVSNEDQREETPDADDSKSGDDDTTDTGESDDTDDEDAADTGDATEETPEQDFDRSSYNRVVRLLQNRDFPLEIEEITTIAGSAYEIERRETEAIIDALVDRGVIDRDGSQLFRPDGGD